MWSVLQSKVRRRFHLPSPLMQLQDVLQKGGYSIPLEAIQYLYMIQDSPNTQVPCMFIYHQQEPITHKHLTYRYNNSQIRHAEH